MATSLENSLTFFDALHLLHSFVTALWESLRRHERQTSLVFPSSSPYLQGWLATSLGNSQTFFDALHLLHSFWMSFWRHERQTSSFRPSAYFTGFPRSCLKSNRFNSFLRWLALSVFVFILWVFFLLAAVWKRYMWITKNSGNTSFAHPLNTYEDNGCET